MTDCITTPYAPSGGMGYGQIELNGKAIMHHRLVYCEANGVTLADIKSQIVMHTCDNPRCVNPKHLQLGTNQTNMADRDAKGRAAVGERNAKSKLTAAQVLEIRARRFGSNKDIGKEFGIDPSCVSDIKTRKSWKHI